MPSDLNTGDIVDVRIMFPNGTDYIVLAQKNVTNIEGETMWLQLAEDERLLLNSAVVDSFLEQGTKLYATKYVDQDAQIKVSDEEAEKYREQYLVSNMQPTENGILMRMVCPDRIPEGAVPVSAELEDAYIAYCGKDIVCEK